MKKDELWRKAALQRKNPPQKQDETRIAFVNEIRAFMGSLLLRIEYERSALNYDIRLNDDVHYDEVVARESLIQDFIDAKEACKKLLQEPDEEGSS